MIYNENSLQDIVSVLAHIDELTKDLGIFDVEINPGAIRSVVEGCRNDFPHLDGIDKASPFKLVANFVCHFVAERPIRRPFSFEAVGNVASVENHQNAIAAFSMARAALNGATIYRTGGESVTIKEPIRLSCHSYADIIEALAGVTPSLHFKLVTVLFEQLIYKTNPSCQYELR